jgi:hypothetical protein
MIRRALSSHWFGIVAGMLFFVLAALTLVVMDGLVPPRSDFVGSTDERFSEFSQPPTRAMGDDGNWMTTVVVENPYGPADGWDAPTPLPFLGLLLILSGAVAARVGDTVVAWRGAVVGAVAVAVGILLPFVDPLVYPPPSDLGGLMTVGAVLGWVGGGMMKLWAVLRTRRAQGNSPTPG